MPLKTMIQLATEKVLPMAAAFLYSFIIPESFLISLLKSFIIAVIVKLILVTAAPLIKRIAVVFRIKLVGLHTKMLLKIKKLKK